MKHIISHKKYNGHRVYRYPNLNPLNLPPYTIRVKYANNTNPYYRYGTATQVSQNPNVWDITYNNSDWSHLLGSDYYPMTTTNIIEVLGANSTNVTSMNHMFYNCTDLSSVQLFDTSNVTNLGGMFSLCSSLTNIPLFDTHNVTYMSNMFGGCSSLTSVPLLNTSKVTSMGAMFSRCSILLSVPLFDTSNVTNMGAMFWECSSLTSVPLFDTRNVTYMEDMFIWCSKLTSVPLLNTSKVTSVDNMFRFCENVETGALALYQQMSSQSAPPSSHSKTFQDCGINTQTGSAELAQIPGDWK